MAEEGIRRGRENTKISLSVKWKEFYSKIKSIFHNFVSEFNGEIWKNTSSFLLLLHISWRDAKLQVHWHAKYKMTKSATIYFTANVKTTKKEIKKMKTKKKIEGKSNREKLNGKINVKRFCRMIHSKVFINITINGFFLVFLFLCFFMLDESTDNYFLSLLIYWSWLVSAPRAKSFQR